MSVRRLAPKELQPANFTFTPENLAWAKKQIAKYPEGRAGVRGDRDPVAGAGTA